MLLCKHLQLYAYKLQLLQQLTSDDRAARKEFAMTVLEKLSDDDECMKKIIFSDDLNVCKV